MIFAAINKSHSIQLFEKNKDFAFCIEDDKTYTGTYWISMDTVFLSYSDMDLSTNILPRKLFINTGASIIQSTEGSPFSAEIYRDQRQKSYNAATNTVRKLKGQKAKLSVLDSD